MPELSHTSCIMFAAPGLMVLGLLREVLTKEQSMKGCSEIMWGTEPQKRHPPTIAQPTNNSFGEEIWTPKGNQP